MNDKRVCPRKKNKELIEKAAERFAEIFIKQIEWNKKNLKNNKYEQRTIYS